jgi:hypothetical protein
LQKSKMDYTMRILFHPLVLVVISADAMSYWNVIHVNSNHGTTKCSTLCWTQEHSFSYNSQIKCLQTYYDKYFFPCFCIWNLCPKFVCTVQLHSGRTKMRLKEIGCGGVWCIQLALGRTK